MTTEKKEKTTTLAALKQSENYAVGMNDLRGFELMQRQARLLSGSTLVPAQYREFIEKKKGDKTEWEQNPSAISNCVVALNMAMRMGADPLMVMQNLYVVEGRPSWSSQWIIAAINGCGRFSPLRFDMEDLGEQDVEYSVSEWKFDEVARKNTRVNRKEKAKIRNLKCVAWATEKETGSRIDSPAVTIEMAVKEGWYGKNGSKWQTMPEVMLRYRTASFFGKLYAPELLMGLQTVEESQDIIDLNPDGSYTLDGNRFTTDELRRTGQSAEVIDQDTGEITPAPASAPIPPETPPENSNLIEESYTFAEVNDMLIKSKSMQALDEAADHIRFVPNEQHQDELRKVYESLRNPD